MEQLWNTVLEILPNDPKCLLEPFECLLSSGLASSSKSIALATVDFWNGCFTDDDRLEYPPLVADSVRTIMRYSKIHVPHGLPEGVRIQHLELFCVVLTLNSRQEFHLGFFRRNRTFWRPPCIPTKPFPRPLPLLSKQSIPPKPMQ
jgi:hypothetical protein